MDFICNTCYFDQMTGYEFVIIGTNGEPIILSYQSMIDLKIFFDVLNWAHVMNLQSTNSFNLQKKTNKHTVKGFIPYSLYLNLPADL